MNVDGCAPSAEHLWMRWRQSGYFGGSSYQDAALRDSMPNAPLPETAPIWRLTASERQAFLRQASADGLLRRDERAGTRLADAVNHCALQEQHKSSRKRTRSGTQGCHYQHACLTTKDILYFDRFRAAHPRAGDRLLAPSQVSKLINIACAVFLRLTTQLIYQAMRMKITRLRSGEARLRADAATAAANCPAQEACEACSEHSGCEALLALASASKPEPVVVACVKDVAHTCRLCGHPSISPSCVSCMIQSLGSFSARSPAELAATAAATAEAAMALKMLRAAGVSVHADDAAREDERDSAESCSRYVERECECSDDDD